MFFSCLMKFRHLQSQQTLWKVPLHQHEQFSTVFFHAIIIRLSEVFANSCRFRSLTFFLLLNFDHVIPLWQRFSKFFLVTPKIYQKKLKKSYDLLNFKKCIIKTSIFWLVWAKFSHYLRNFFWNLMTLKIVPIPCLRAADH